MGYDPNQPRVSGGPGGGQWTSSDIGGVAARAKSVNSNGPAGVTAYHGSDTKFWDFDESMIGARDAGYLGRGFYFSSDPGVTDFPFHGMEVQLHFANPLKISLPTMGADKQAIVRDALGLAVTSTPQQVTDALLKKGHDAVVLDYGAAGYASSEIMVPKAKQITLVKHFKTFKSGGVAHMPGLTATDRSISWG